VRAGTHQGWWLRKQLAVPERCCFEANWQAHLLEGEVKSAHCGLPAEGLTARSSLKQGPFVVDFTWVADARKRKQGCRRHAKTDRFLPQKSMVPPPTSSGVMLRPLVC
jgi:hypothetical protein